MQVRPTMRTRGRQQQPPQHGVLGSPRTTALVLLAVFLTFMLVYEPHYYFQDVAPVIEESLQPNGRAVLKSSLVNMSAGATEGGAQKIPVAVARSSVPPPPPLPPPSSSSSTVAQQLPTTSTVGGVSGLDPSWVARVEDSNVRWERIAVAEKALTAKHPNCAFPEVTACHRFCCGGNKVRNV